MHRKVAAQEESIRVVHKGCVHILQPGADLFFDLCMPEGGQLSPAYVRDGHGGEDILPHQEVEGQERQCQGRFKMFITDMVEERLQKLYIRSVRDILCGDESAGGRAFVGTGL